MLLGYSAESASVKDLANRGRMPVIGEAARCCHPGPGARSANIATFGFGYTRPIASAMKDKNYVLRPWTEEEEEDYQRFCDSIEKMPEDPVHARLMEDGEVDFFDWDEWPDEELPRA